MKKIIALLFLSSLASATAVIDQGPKIFGLTHTSAIAIYHSSTAGTTKYGVDTVSHSSYSAVSENYALHQQGQSYLATITGLHQWFAYSLLPATTYYYRACSDDGTEGCSAEFSFVTLSTPTPHPSPAILPQQTVDMTMPSCDNQLLHCVGGVPVTATVGPNADDPSTGLIALVTAATWGDTIIIPTTTYLGGQYVFPARTPDTHNPARWIVVESGNYAKLPQPGVRVGLKDLPNMPYAEQTHYGVLMATDTPSDDCTPGGYNWNGADGVDPAYNLAYCGAVQQISISSLTYVGTGKIGAEFNIVLSSPLLSSVYWVNMEGLPYPHAMGTGFVLNTVDPEHMTIETMAGYTDSTSMGTVYPTTGTLTAYDFTAPAYVSYSGSSPTVSCTTGQWAYSNLQPDGSTPLDRNTCLGQQGATDCSTGRVWHCTSTNNWTRWVPQLGGGNGPQQTQWDTTGVMVLTNASHIRLIGLNFGNAPVIYDPLAAGQLGPTQSVPGGINGQPYIVMDDWTDHVIVDRCIIQSHWPMEIGTLLQMNGDYVGVINSWIREDAGEWSTIDNRGPWRDNDASDKVSYDVGGPKILYNNYLEGYGIVMHSSDQHSGTNTSPHDVTIRNNYFHVDLSRVYGSATFNQNFYTPLRQLLELKRGLRYNVDGNVFDGNFRNVAQGAAVATTPQPVNPGGFWCVNMTTSSIGNSGTCSITVRFNGKVGDYLQANDGTTYYALITSTSSSGETSTFSFSPASSTWGAGPPPGYPFFGDMTPDSEGVWDFTFTNNILTNLSTAFIVTSHYGPGFMPAYERLTVQNNLMYNWGPGADGTLGLGSDAWQTSGAGGDFVALGNGLNDTIVNHNTMYGFTQNPYGYASYQSILVPYSFDAVVPDNEALQYTNNISVSTTTLEIAQNNTISNGNTFLNQFFSGVLPYTVTNNVTVRSGGNPGNYQTPNVWTEVTTSTNPFVNYSIHNFTLANQYRAQDTCYSVPGDCTTDGTDEGVNMAQLMTAQGPNLPLNFNGYSSIYPYGVTIKGTIGFQ